MMQVVFLSNYFSHHQKPISDVLAERCHYTFLATEELSQERKSLGWGQEQQPDYVCNYFTETQRATECLEQADVVIAGSAPEALIQQCIRSGKVVLRYSERPLKNGSEPLKYVPRLIRWHHRNPKYKPVYLLCASAFAASDYAKFGLFRGKAFRWGYFPEVKCYADGKALMAQKQKHTILWVGRFLDWKHPDDAIYVASQLKEMGIPFDMTLIGTGPMECQLRQQIDEQQLHACIHLAGSMKPEDVRMYMERSQIYLFTSDRKEGWGAVLNEAMNSGCAVVASHAAGATPYLIQHEKDGLVYRSGDREQLLENVKQLLLSPERSADLGFHAYEKIYREWNAEIAANRLLDLINAILRKEKNLHLFIQGPCSAAPVMNENSYNK